MAYEERMDNGMNSDEAFDKIVAGVLHPEIGS